jgi:hypothetical protein
LVVSKSFLDMCGLVLKKSFFDLCVFCDKIPAKLKKSTFFLFFIIKYIGKKIKRTSKNKNVTKKTFLW